MKILLTLCLLFSVSCYSQSKGDSKIIVAVGDTSNLVNRVVKSLYERGYSIETKDMGFIVTNDRDLKKYPFKIKVSISLNGSMTITGKIKPAYKTEFENRYFDVEFKGEKNNPFKEAFAEIVEIGKLFGSVSYSK